MAHWLIPCDPSLYDAEGAFKEYGRLTWHQSCNISRGDTVYLYFTSPLKVIRCVCTVEESGLPFDIDPGDDGYVLDQDFAQASYRRYMVLRLVKTFDDPCLSWDVLRLNGLNGPIRSQRKVPEELLDFIRQITG